MSDSFSCSNNYSFDSIIPDIIEMINFSCWNDFFEYVYEVFVNDFINSKPLFRGTTIGFKRYPEYQGRSSTFWHIISEGAVENERTPCVKRCERITWPRPIIDNSEHQDLMVWIEKQKGEERLHILFEKGKYIVVLNKRNGYWLFWTAFYIDKTHQVQKYYKRYQRNKDLEIIV